MTRQTLRFTHDLGRGIATQLGIKYRGVVYRASEGREAFIFRDPETNRGVIGISLSTTRAALEKARKEGVCETRKEHGTIGLYA